MRPEILKRDFLPTFFSRTGRTLLWIVGGLTLLGCLWREPATATWTATLGLTIWTEIVVILFRIPGLPCRKTELVAGSPFRYAAWIPALLPGMLLTGRSIGIFLGFLVFFEIVRGLVRRYFRFDHLRFPETKALDPTRHRPRWPAADLDDPSQEALQRILRTRNRDGKIRMECFFTVEFVEDQKTAGVHIPFWPGFETPPRVEARIEEGEARVTIRQPLLYGVRIDVRREDSRPGRLHLFVTVEESTAGTPD